jgi:hypothetical protein
MSAVIKNEQIDPNLAKCIARLKLAKAHLEDVLKGRDFDAIMKARKSVQSSILLLQEASKNAENTPGNSVASAIGISLICASDLLCKDASEGLRLFFEVIPGGKE